MKYQPRIYFLLRLVLSLCFLMMACQPHSTDTIRFSTWGSAKEMAILKPLLEEFKKKNPDIQLELWHIPDKYFQKLHTLIAANLTPDVVFTNNIHFPLYASNGAFISLQPYLEKSSVLKVADFFPRTLAGFQWQGKQQGIPRDVSNLVFYYNQDLFDQYHVPYPQAGWTLKEFLETAKKLTIDQDGDGKPDIFGVSFDTYFLFWLPYLWSHGGDFFDPTRKQFILNQRPSYTGLQFYADLRHRFHVAPTTAETGNAKMTQLFMQGKVAMQLTGRWVVPSYREELTFRWDIVTFPQGSAGSVVDADGSGWAISRKCKHPDQAWRLIEFLAGRQSSEAFSQQGLIIPARQDVAFSALFLSPGKAPAHANFFLDSLATAQPVPAVPYWNEIIETIHVALEPVWEGKRSAQEAMEGIQDQINQLL